MWKVALPIQSLEQSLIQHLSCLRKLAEALRNNVDHQKEVLIAVLGECQSKYLLSASGLHIDNFLVEFWSSLPKPSGRKRKDAQRKAGGFH